MMLIFAICPLVAGIISILMIIFAKKKRFSYFIVLALVLAIFSYYYMPTVKDDLYRHHLEVISLGMLSHESFMMLISSRTEQLSLIMKYLISKTADVNLLQFIITLIDYLIIFYILHTTTQKYKLSNLSYFLILLFTVLSFNYLTIISNLFNTLGLLIFSLGVFLEYGLNKNKIFSYILYIITPFIHSSMVVPIVLIILFKLMREKGSIKAMILIALGIMLIEPVLNFMVDTFNTSLFIELKSFYNHYFINEENFSYLHTTSVLVLYLSKLIPFIIGYIFLKEKSDKETSFALVCTFAILALFTKSTFAIRFIPLVQMASISLLCKIYSSGNKQAKIFFGLIMIVLIIFLGYYQYIQLYNREFISIGELLGKNILNVIGG